LDKHTIENSVQNTKWTLKRQPNPGTLIILRVVRLRKLFAPGRAFA
jgi:hypothetical protein